MDAFSILKGYNNPTSIFILGARELRNDTIINSSSVLSLMLMDANGVKVVAGLSLF